MINIQENNKDVFATIQCLLPAGFDAFVIGDETIVPVTSLSASISPPSKILKMDTGTAPCPLTQEVFMYIYRTTKIIESVIQEL